MANYRRMDVDQVGDVTVVRFRDQKIVEDISIQELGAEMFHLVEVENRDKLLLNFSGVDFLSSAALGKLITLDKKVKAQGGVLKLSNIRPEIYEVFTITRLNRPVRHQGRRGGRLGVLLAETTRTLQRRFSSGGEADATKIF